MAFARFSKGLRRGSTKTETYSTLATRKYGRVQIVKDRVTDIKNPQTISQMQQRVIFATVTKAAQKMADLIEISRKGQGDRNFARQEFITENIAYIRSVAGKRIGTNRHYLAAYAPKGNLQIIPNSYIVSKGSLNLPVVYGRDGQPSEIWDVNTSENKGSFGASSFKKIGTLGALPFGTYTRAELIAKLFGLLPGDQLTFPQILGSDTAQTMLDGETIVDKTLVTFFAAPRIVMKSDMGTDTIEISNATQLAALVTFIKEAIDDERSYMPIVDEFTSVFEIDDTADDIMTLHVDDTYANLMSVNTTLVTRAFGIILSRNVDGIWDYSNCQLVCVWDFIGSEGGYFYFGFTIDGAVETYLPAAKTDTEGNFLQRGGSADIVPASFR